MSNSYRMKATPQLQKGILLLAEPFMLDPGFKRSAILLCDHSHEGSVGFILNKPLNVPVDTLLAEFPAFEATAYYGGPVANDTLHYVHNIGHILDESMEIAHGVYWGGNFSQLKALIKQGLVTDQNIQFFVGYSGWSSRQLEEEMEVQSWVIAPFYPNYIFGQLKGDLWKIAMRELGSTYELLSDMGETSLWN